MKIYDYVIRGAKYTYRGLTHKKFDMPECDCDRQSANDTIFSLLTTEKPCMIARFGTAEINCVNNYLCVHSNRSFVLKCYDYITDMTHTPWWNTDHFKYMYLNAGVFPCEQAIMERFSERYLQDIPEIDILASHQYYEKFMPVRSDVERIQLEMLYPFFVERPWTRILKGKRVLVIHPFEQTILQQYEKRSFLFDNPDVLPEFELITLKAVQTAAGCTTEFGDWFEALRYMEDKIDMIDFDYALIGCGAYGLSLAAHIRRKGGKAIHMGGGLQLLFGILGKRWVDVYPRRSPMYGPRGEKIEVDYTSLFNSNWCYPLAEDTPENAKIVENACYWG